jgi:two-component system response regulator AtoC
VSTRESSVNRHGRSVDWEGVETTDTAPPHTDEPQTTSGGTQRLGPEMDSAARVRRELMLWVSPNMQEIRDVISEAARVDVTVLVTGETGTGKELAARAIHHLGARRHGPFVKVNCAAVARELLESELFGHERGAFTGAHRLKVGKFEAAHRGTIFLDEIGDLHPALQAKLLHVLEDGQFSRVGGQSNIKVDTRIVAATNQDLDRAVAAGDFRGDLYYRLNVIRIAIPPLRERPEDIPGLVGYLFERYSKLFGRTGFTLSHATVERLIGYSFPGNVRELENLIKRMIVLRDPDLAMDPALSAALDAQGPRAEKSDGTSLKSLSRRAAQAVEREAILKALNQTHWNRLRAAKLLNISYRSLFYKLHEVGLAGKRDAPNHS